MSNSKSMVLPNTMLNSAAAALKVCWTRAILSALMANGMLMAVAKKTMPRIDPIPNTRIYTRPTLREGTAASTSRRRAALPASP